MDKHFKLVFGHGAVSLIATVYNFTHVPTLDSLMQVRCFHIHDLKQSILPETAIFLADCFFFYMLISAHYGFISSKGGCGLNVVK